MFMKNTPNANQVICVTNVKEMLPAITCHIQIKGFHDHYFSKEPICMQKWTFPHPKKFIREIVSESNTVLKKCNLTLAMSPTCHCNISFADMNFS